MKTESEDRKWRQKVETESEERHCENVTNQYGGKKRNTWKIMHVFNH